MDDDDDDDGGGGGGDGGGGGALVFLASVSMCMEELKPESKHSAYDTMVK
jgi:GTPase involved in cell partitioning and DNA repair